VSNNISNETLYTNMLHDLTQDKKIKGPKGWGDIGAWDNPFNVVDNLSRIFYHESKHDPKAVQETFVGGKGQGKGLGQYSYGEDKGAHNAIDRAINYYNIYSKDKSPKWLSDIKYPYNLNELDVLQQAIIALGDKALKRGSNLSGDYQADPSKLTEEWLLRHWAGFNPNNPSYLGHEGEPLINTIIKKINSFHHSMGEYDKATDKEYTGKSVLDILTQFQSE
jgi:hypothetical protein